MKKLILKKVDVSNLNTEEMKIVKGELAKTIYVHNCPWTAIVLYCTEPK